MSAGRIVREALQLVDDVAGVAKAPKSSLKALESEGKAARFVEEIDIGATPLPDEADDVTSVVDRIKGSAFGTPQSQADELEQTPFLPDELLADEEIDYEDVNNIQETLNSFWSPSTLANNAKFPSDDSVMQEAWQQYNNGMITIAELKTTWGKELGLTTDDVKETIAADFPGLETYLNFVSPEFASNMYNNLKAHKVGPGDFFQIIKGEAEESMNTLNASGQVIAKPVYDISDPGSVEEVKGWILNTFDHPDGGSLTPGEIDSVIGTEWAVKLGNLFEKGHVDELEAQDFINYVIKSESDIPEIDEAELDAWDSITDKFEDAPLQSIDATVTEHIDVDSKWIGNHNQNSPYSFEDLVGSVEPREGYRDAPEWTHSLDDKQRQALTLMTHMREDTFPNIKGYIFNKNYHGHQDKALARLDPKWPPSDTWEDIPEIDIAALNFYTKTGDGVMNAALRQKAIEPGSDLEAAIEATQGALQRLPSWNPADSNGVLFRRIDDKNLMALFDNMEEGQEYTELGFMSTTRKDAVDIENLKATEKWGDYLPYLTLVIKPKAAGSRAHGIEGTSEYISEAEVLYEHGTQFRIVGKEYTTQNADDDFMPALLVFIEEI